MHVVYPPRTMCSQHPDYVNVPSWVSGEYIQGDDEVHEAYLAYSYYGCQEVMWDFEGKDADFYVIRKLLSKYPDFFRKYVLGEDVYLTLRVPNPRVEVAERKVFSQALELIPVANDVAREFYGRDARAVFQVIYPLTSSWVDLALTLRYYERVIVGKGEVELIDGIKVIDVLGDVMPKTIDVIPLVEDMGSLLNIGGIITGFWKVARPRQMRVFIARSDPAMNYGLIPAVILAKIAISRTLNTGMELGVDVYPIIGVGSVPFRGGFNPQNVDNVIGEYKGVITFTVQSSFRYDNPYGIVKDAISHVNELVINDDVDGSIINNYDEYVLLRIVNHYINDYQYVIEGLASLINTVASLMPSRRARKLHIGLFGYSRGFRGITLPRAIPFVASLYSLGIPPEIIGVSTLRDLGEEEWRVLNEYYLGWRRDLDNAGKYVCLECIQLIMNYRSELGIVNSEIFTKIEDDIRALEWLGIKVGPRDYESRRHELYAQLLINSLREGRYDDSRKYVIEMARIRGFLG
ncbi:MAG: phosphoenolpyruvate carboxylase [Vulcanisaeta sp.]